MTSKHDYVETPGGCSVAPFKPDPGDDALPVGLGPTRSGAQRFATVADVYGPFREDSMELMEEKAYQRGMLQHIRESTQALDLLDLHPDTARSRTLPVRRQSDNGGNYSSQGEAFGAQSTDGAGQTRHVTVWDDLSMVYRPKPTYYDLGQKVSTRPQPPPPRTYTRFFSTTTPRAYPETLSRDTEDANYTSRVYHPTGPSSHPGGWANHLQPNPSVREEFSDWHVPNTSRAPPPPPPPVLLPLLGTGQALHGYGSGCYGNGYDRSVGNGDPRKLSLDVNVNMYQAEPGHREGQRSSGGQMPPDGRLRPYVPPLALNQPKAMLQLNQVTPAPSGSNHHHLPFHRQPWTDRSIGDESVYPYRSMKNPWFPKPDSIPPPPTPAPPHSVRHHYRRGKYGYYRVFDINDFKKLQKELRLGSLVGEEKDFETIEDKKEKKAILSEYGRLVRVKNREEMKPNYSFV